jgi:hypothetical protein
MTNVTVSHFAISMQSVTALLTMLDIFDKLETRDREGCRMKAADESRESFRILATMIISDTGCTTLN